VLEKKIKPQWMLVIDICYFGGFRTIRRVWRYQSDNKNL
jgi:hypothetical protein